MKLESKKSAVLFEIPHKIDQNKLIMVSANILHSSGYRVRVTNPIYYTEKDREPAVLVVIVDGVTPNQEQIIKDYNAENVRVVIFPAKAKQADLKSMLFPQVPIKAQTKPKSKPKKIVKDEEVK